LGQWKGVDPDGKEIQLFLSQSSPSNAIAVKLIIDNSIIYEGFSNLTGYENPAKFFYLNHHLDKRPFIISEVAQPQRIALSEVLSGVVVGQKIWQTILSSK
jgi:hypothetical protein